MVDPTPYELTPKTIPTHSAESAGYAVWQWNAAESQWNQLEDRSKAGFSPGTGPTTNGRFNLQTVRWPSVPVD